MMEAVHRYEGTVNQVMGDGVMARFGAPLAHEDHAVRACYAALRMQEVVKAYGAEARRVHGVNVQIRVGLNSGEVVVRAIGNDLRMDYTALAEEIGMRPLVAHCHLGLGLASRRQREEARRHVTTAASMYREMDMRFWSRQADAAMAALA
jgi:hypothetical protein